MLALLETFSLQLLNASYQPAISFAGQDTLSSFMALAARCRVLITNESGAMHIASAVGTPVVAMFGPTDPHRTAPMDPQTTVLRHDVPCSPCFRTICPFPDHPCMRLIPSVVDLSRQLSRYANVAVLGVSLDSACTLNDL